MKKSFFKKSLLVSLPFFLFLTGCGGRNHAQTEAVSALSAVPVTQEPSEGEARFHASAFSSSAGASAEDQTAKCLSELDAVSGTNDLTSFGGYTLSDKLQTTINNIIQSTQTDGCRLGFIMMDIGTGAGICYQSDASFYSASSAKAPFVVGTASAYPNSVQMNEDMYKEITVYSSNDAFWDMEGIYGFDADYAWMSDAGVDVTLDSGGFTFFTPEQLARIWLKNYAYFETDANGETVGSWFETPETSVIHESLGSQYTTRSKAGWMADSDENYNASTDAGIVYADGHPYILVVMSDIPDSLPDLRGTVLALNTAHDELVSVAY